MMCVDVIQRVKAMHKSIRIEQSLNSSRRITVRSSRSASPVRMNQNTLSVKHQTLAEIQEDMKSDFQTSQQKEAHSALSKPVKRTRKESLECSMRLTGSLSYQTVNRHRHPQHNMEIENNQNTTLLQDTLKEKQISSTPLRFRSVKTAIDG